MIYFSYIAEDNKSIIYLVLSKIIIMKMRFSNLPIADLVINIQMSKRSAENVNPLVLQREWRTDC